MILGTLKEIENGEGLSLLIDGEETPTEKAYKFLASYIPTLNDRVLIEEIGDSYVVIGKLIDSTANITKAPSSAMADKAKADESGNNIKAYYAHSAKNGTSNNIIQILNADGTVLSSVTIDNVANATNASKATSATSANSASSATKATQDESGNNIKGYYAHSLSLGTTSNIVRLLNANGAQLSSVTVNNVANATNASNATSIVNQYSSSASNIYFRTNGTWSTADLQFRLGTNGTWYTLTKG